MGHSEDNPGLTRVKFELRAGGVPEDSPNALRSGIHTRGYLPHVKREGASYFVTFRLADSLPRQVLLGFEHEFGEAIRRAGPNANGEQVGEMHRELRRKIERYLDQGVGACHLRNPKLADLVAETICHFHKERYLLDDWVVMPNHVHVILWLMPNFLLSDILKSWKQFSSRRAKKFLGLHDNAFWQPESYDHWIRDDDEKARIRRYIRNNPVNAGLCLCPEDWRWSSAWKPPAESKTS